MNSGQKFAVASHGSNLNLDEDLINILLERKCLSEIVSLCGHINFPDTDWKKHATKYGRTQLLLNVIANIFLHQVYCD